MTFGRGPLKRKVQGERQRLELEKQRMAAAMETQRAQDQIRLLQQQQQQQQQQQPSAPVHGYQGVSRFASRPTSHAQKAPDPVRQWLQDAETPAVAAKASVAGAAPPRANVNQAQPQTIHDVMLWLDDIGMGKYRQQFQVNEIDGEMLLQLQDQDLGEVGVPAWSGDRQRILSAIQHLKNPDAPPPPVNPVSIAGAAGGGRAMERLPDNPVNEWLLSTGFGRFRTTFTQHGIFELHDLCQMERNDLLELGIQDQGGQLGRLEAAISGLRYTLQSSHAAFGAPALRGALGRPVGGTLSQFDAESKWETETVSTARSGKSKSSRRSKSKESRKKKRIDFSHIEEAVKVSDIFGHVWDKRFATLEANRLCLYKGAKAPTDRNEKPKTDILLDGLIIDDSEKKEHSVFIVKSLFTNSAGDMLIHFSDSKTANLWKERLQAASFYHNMPREKQLAGLAAGKDKRKEEKPEQRRVDDYGNKLPTVIPAGMPFHDIPVAHARRDERSERSAPSVAPAAGSPSAVSTKGAATKASAFFRGPVKSFTIIGMEVRNASTAFESPFLAVGIFGSGGTLKLSLPDIPLKGGENKVQMRFDIGAKASVPDEVDSVLFFELRHKIKGKEQGPKYWTCAMVSSLSKGRHQLQLYKAPVEYALSKQKRQPKQNCHLVLQLH